MELMGARRARNSFHDRRSQVAAGLHLCTCQVRAPAGVADSLVDRSRAGRVADGTEEMSGPSMLVSHLSRYGF
jgi:hypothetical protein